jgi:hypothetical protein
MTHADLIDKQLVVNALDEAESNVLDTCIICGEQAAGAKLILHSDYCLNIRIRIGEIIKELEAEVRTERERVIEHLEVILACDYSVSSYFTLRRDLTSFVNELKEGK